MKLIVKALQEGGKEYPLEVENDSVSVHDVKKLLEGMVNKPMEQQSLVHNGKALSDSQKLCDYSIVDGTELYMVSKPPPPAEPQPPPTGASVGETVWKNKTIHVNILYLFLRDHFNVEDSRKIIECYRRELRKIVYDTSLDVVELLAIETLKMQAAQGQ